MSPVFDAYAAYYDLLYRDKDYAGEASWVDALIQRHRPGAKTMLDLGCGTGQHAMEFAQRGYAVTGVDRSPEMVARAQARVEAGNSGAIAPSFVTGDLRTFRASRSYDVVLSLFHVMSYQTSNTDLLAGMRTAVENLQPGGLFIFDCWYGPGVLSEPPETRVRRMQGDGFQVTRIAEPEQLVNSNRVDVHYDILVERHGAVERIRECHAMRYLFGPEVQLMLEVSGLTLLNQSKWLCDEDPDTNSWTACFVASRSTDTCK